MQRDRTIEFWNKFYLDYTINKTKSDDKNYNDDGSCNNHSNDDDDNNHPNKSCPQQQQHHQQQQQNHPNYCKEWILEPSKELFDILLERIFPDHNDSSCTNNQNNDNNIITTRPYRILEIGCGNSRFAIELWKYLLQLQQKTNTNNDDDMKSSLPVGGTNDDNVNNDTSGSSTIRSRRRRKIIPKCIQFVATDVSPVCIEQIQQRDTKEIQELSELYNCSSINDLNTATENCYYDNNDNQQYFQYSILNVVEPDDINWNNKNQKQFDLIIDKGCLDTFLFRSKSRGSSTNGTGGGAYTELIQSVLNNIHSWLYSPSNNNNTTTDAKINEPGKYIILSPRSKHKSVRDYNGFSKVERFGFDTSTIQLGALEGKRSIDKSTNAINKKKKKQNKSTSDDGVFMYICHKDPDFDSTCIIKNDDSNNTDNNNNNNNNNNDAGGEEKQQQNHSSIRGAVAYSIEIIVPDDNDTSSKCLISFYTFRNGENLVGRGKHYWCRSWKGHCLHCKEINLNK